MQRNAFPLGNRRYDAGALAAELGEATGVWQSKSEGGGWSSLTIRSSEASESPHLSARTPGAETYAYTPLAEQLPRVRAVLDSLGTGVLLVRYLKLEPGELVKFHTDEMVFSNTSKIVRLHLPVVTNDKAVLRFGTPLREPSKGYLVWEAKQEWEVHMPAGHVWFTNVNALHSVYNGGQAARIHLVIDVQPRPGLAKALKRWQNELIVALGQERSA